MKKILILLGMLILMIGLSSIIKADPTCTVNVPASDTAYNGTINVNITIDTKGTGDYNITGFNMSTTADADFVDCRGGINLSSYKCSANTATNITEVRRTTVTANVLVNNTGTAGVIKNGSCTSTLVDFDNTNPVCSQSIDFEQIESLHPLTIDCSRSTDTTDKTYSIVLTRDDSSTVTKTPTDGLSIFDSADTEILGWATIQCTVTDEVTKTNACTAENVWIGSGEPTIPPPIIVSSIQEEEDNTIVLLIGGIIIITVIILIIIFVSIKAGKKKRR